MEFYSPASSYLFALKKKIEDKKYSTWFSCLPEDHIKGFLVYGIKPFLKKYGYVLGFSDEKMVSYLKRWAYNIFNKSNKKFVLIAHDGDDDMYDWFRYSIPMDDWGLLAHCWKAPEFLDESNAGLRQINDLPDFIWACINLDLSKQHIKWLDMNSELEEEEMWIYDDTYAYGGDRRTY
jgi:hypothetical protein